MRQIQRLSQADLLDQVQRLLLPFASRAHVTQQLEQARARGVLNESDAGYDPWSSLHNLSSRVPEFFEDRELRSLAAEAALLENLAASGPLCSTYRIRQRVRARSELLSLARFEPLWVPMPRHIPGVQEVTVESINPEWLIDYHLPEAGLLYGLPWPATGLSVPVEIELCLEVQQNLRGLLAWRDSELCASDTPSRPVVRRWLDEVGIGPIERPEDAIASVIEAMEAAFEHTVVGPFPPEVLLRSGMGNTETRSAFLVLALQQLGFAARLCGGQALMLDGRSATLTFPGSLGYEHRFVAWADATSASAGSIDSSYLQRWGFWGTRENTRDAASFEGLKDHGERYRELMIRSPYPLDFLVAGIPPRDGSTIWQEGSALAAFDTELCVERI